MKREGNKVGGKRVKEYQKDEYTQVMEIQTYLYDEDPSHLLAIEKTSILINVIEA